MKNRHCWIIMFLVISFSSKAQNASIPFNDNISQKALISGLDIINLHIPSSSYTVDDYAVDILDGGFATYFDEEMNTLLDDYRISKKGIYDDATYSPFLHRLKSELENKNKNYEYILEVSSPYKGIIGCELLPIDKKIDSIRDTESKEFVIRYDQQTGEIIQFSKKEVFLD